MTSTAVKKIQLIVPSDYTVDPWFSHASPHEVAIVIDLAGRLQRVVGDEKNEMAAKLFAARQEGTEQAIQKMLVEASKISESKFNQELIEVKTKLQASQEKTEKLEQTVREQNAKIEQANVDQNLMSSKHEYDLKENERILQVELDKIKVMERHLAEKHNMQVDAIKRESIYEMSKQCENMRLDYDRLKYEHNQLLQSMDTKIRTSIEEATRVARAEMTENYDTLHAIKLETDNTLMKAITEKCEMSTTLNTQSAAHIKEVAQLREKISELQNPYNRGTTGEFDTAQTLRDIGFHVEDTSEGDKKDAGFLDLLVKPDALTTENSRIAIEVKNKKTIKKASDNKVKNREKDLDDDIKTFQQRARDGIKNGLFDAAMFVSIRAHTKMGAPVVLVMFEDSTDRALAPVSYIGPEKSKIVVPLSQEQLECQMHMMFCVLEQCHLIRRDLCNGLKDNEISSFQTLFDRMGEHLNKTFVDLRKQEALIHEMQTNLTGIRCRCIQMFRSVYTINSKIPWLKRKLDADWISVYDTAKERRKTMTEGEVWNAVSKNKSTIEQSIGKDAMFMAIRNENSDAPSSSGPVDLTQVC